MVLWTEFKVCVDITGHRSDQLQNVFFIYIFIHSAQGNDVLIIFSTV